MSKHVGLSNSDYHDSKTPTIHDYEYYCDGYSQYFSLKEKEHIVITIINVRLPLCFDF